jgi:hypothetical protein
MPRTDVEGAGGRFDSNRPSDAAPCPVVEQNRVVPTSDPRLLPERVGLGRDGVLDLLAHLRECLAVEVAAVADERRSTGTAIPIIDYTDVATSLASESARTAITRRGVVVVRGTFERAEAEAWNDEIGSYLATNRYEERFARPDPETNAPPRRIWGVYWSRPQVQARQHARMVTVRRFLNGFWSHRSSDTNWFDPDHDIGYPDRLRRRAPGVPAAGLRVHTDAPVTGGWSVPENPRVFREVFAGRPEQYDPWDATERTPIAPWPAALASVFRTFQGWTALSEMRPDDGVLHTIPIPSAATHSLIEGLAGELGLLGDDPTPAPRRARPDPLLLDALTPIPAVEPGDTVWWHGDVFHSVADAANRERWGNVMYIGSTPRCARNDPYPASTFDRFLAGRSPVDYPAEDHEIDFVGRAGIDDLDEVGRQQFGLDPIVRK